MIDIIKAKKFLKEYITRYNPENPRIALKIAHIYRTSEKAKWLAEKLKLNQEDILLAELIGLLHDIGRFEQIKQYNTFFDKDSINHGEYGVKILFDDGLIRDSDYDEIIKKAIMNHNRNRSKDINNSRELTHCKIIRDADKLDIYYVLLNDSIEAAYPLDRYPKEPISKEIKNEFISNHQIDYGNVKTCVDLLIGQIAYLFDINYLYSLEKIKEANYINEIIKRFHPEKEETIKDLALLNEVANQYVEEKIKEGAICLKNY